MIAKRFVIALTIAAALAGGAVLVRMLLAGARGQYVPGPDALKANGEFVLPGAQFEGLYASRANNDLIGRFDFPEQTMEVEEVFAQLTSRAGPLGWAIETPRTIERVFVKSASASHSGEARWQCVRIVFNEFDGRFYLGATGGRGPRETFADVRRDPFFALMDSYMTGNERGYPSVLWPDTG